MRLPRATCSVCLGEFALSAQGAVAKHGKPEACPGSRFPHLGADSLGLHWAIDHLAALLSGARDELMIHRMRAVLQDTADVLTGHGLDVPASPITLDRARDPSWLRREAELVASVASVTARLDRLTQALTEWEPSGPVPPARPVIHLRSLWRNRAGTEVPRCWAGALQRPRTTFVLTDLGEEVTCEDGCKKSAIKTA